jgi:hypothetical protein
MKTKTPAAGEAAGAARVVQGEQHTTTALPPLFQPQGTMLECARRYATNGLHILPPIRNGNCGCGNPKCSSVGKHSRIRWKAGATCDPATVEALSRAGAPGPSGLGVFDLDWPKGLETRTFTSKLSTAIDPSKWPEILRALACIPPDCGRDMRLPVGMAIHSTGHPYSVRRSQGDARP